MNELETLIDQQRREMRRPWAIFHWSRSSVQASLSLDLPIGPSADGSLTFADVLVEGVNAWFPWAFSAVPTYVEPGDRALGITDALSAEDVARYHAEWGGA